METHGNKKIFLSYQGHVIYYKKVNGKNYYYLTNNGNDKIFKSFEQAMDYIENCSKD